MSIANTPPPHNGFDPDFATPAEWAALYRACGLQVIPGWMPGEVKGAWKRPKLADWVPLQNALAPDTTFDRWYNATTGENRNRPNMGLITGACSGRAFIVDLDTYKNPAAMQWWRGVLAVNNNDIEPETPRQRTGGGGLQIMFRAPPGWTPPTNRTPIGVDIRGQAGFAVLPPSLHDSGATYNWLPGCAPWEIPIMEAPDWLCTAIDELVGVAKPDLLNQPLLPSDRALPGDPKPAEPHNAEDFTAFGKRQDGREEYMATVVWAAVVDLYRESPIQPPQGQMHILAMRAYEAYERKVVTRYSDLEKRDGLEREGRGLTAFHTKWLAAMKHWGDRVASDAAKPKPAEDKSGTAFDFNTPLISGNSGGQAAAALYEVLDIAQIKAMPDPKWLVEGLVIEQSLGFIYGPPGCLKTFIALDMALCVTTGQSQWWDRPVHRHGAVIYISSEGQANLKFRIMAWEQHHGVTADAAPFRLIRQGINFTRGEDIQKLLATVQAVADGLTVPIAAVFVDTVSRVLPGVDENLQKDMTIFVAGCDAVRQRFGCVVVGLHHTNKGGSIRGSTVLPGAGDFMIEVHREPGAMEGSIHAEKIKDAEDGWDQFFKVAKIELPTVGKHTSLALDPTVGPVSGDGLPSRDVCRNILASIDEEWGKGRPWCYAKNSARCAEINIMKKWNIDRRTVQKLLELWHANGVISEEVRDTKNHIKGFKKLLDI